jgi:hypothetical protein
MYGLDPQFAQQREGVVRKIVKCIRGNVEVDVSGKPGVPLVETDHLEGEGGKAPARRAEALSFGRSATNSPCSATSRLIRYGSPKAPWIFGHRCRDGTKIFAVGEQRRGELVMIVRRAGSISIFRGSRPITWTSRRTSSGLPIQLIPKLRFGAAGLMEARSCSSASRRCRPCFPAGRRTAARSPFWVLNRARPLGFTWFPLTAAPPRLMLSAGGMEVDPNWSPDGTRAPL